MSRKLTFCDFNQNRQVLGNILPLKMPLGITISITNLCNFKCFYCSVSQTENERKSSGILLKHMPYQDFKKDKVY